MNQNNIGIKFKKLRKIKGLSQDEVCKNITSRSRLSRWENGSTESGMPIEIVKQLMNRINISYEELFSDDDNTLQIMNKIQKLYQDNKSTELGTLAKELLKISQNDDSTILLAAIAANFYFDLSNNNLFSPTAKKKLTDYCYSIKNWSEDEIRLFGNVQLLLDSQTIYNLSRSLISTLYERKHVNDYDTITLLNGVFSLIKRKELTYAKNLLKRINFLNISSYDYLALYRIDFTQYLLDIIRNHTDYSKLNALFAELSRSSKFDQLLSDFKFAFEQVKQIYHLEDN
ncbi:Rgg/GadR/MutR family transcriptional regulator [Lactobacillus sp.]|uniref:helix-turn-helix domain-containing protein n=1 Tax=Lactobacillus sp. TaxID=1591 RepID=UPI0019A32750|nr:Rgg/GadR/MutR family transcriptional regulator [Lactobacillus sp.]MBD5429508.1 helix-turn-helix domain-containing protein [Lactobacillus sp.]